MEIKQVKLELLTQTFAHLFLGHLQSNMQCSYVKKFIAGKQVEQHTINIQGTEEQSTGLKHFLTVVMCRRLITMSFTIN